MTQLDDKIALITGGGRGIGRAVALQLAECVARVAEAARSEDQLAGTTAAVADAGGDAITLVADGGRRRPGLHDPRPEASAAALILCLSGDETGRIWDVDDLVAAP